MRRSKREERRERAEAARQQRAARKVHEKHNREVVEQRLQAVLSVERGPVQRVEQTLETGRGALFNKVRGEVHVTEKVALLLRLVSRKAPRLLEPDYVAALYHVAQLDWERPVAEWKPKGKGRDTLFRNLCSHLLARYPMPTILWGAFFEPSVRALAPVVSFVASGGSLFKAVQQDMLPIPLTKKMCHELLSTPGEKFMAALRRAQILGHDGDRMLHQAWMDTDVGKEVHDRATEEFWVTVLRWFCQNPMLDRRQVGPLLDFISFRRRQDPDFSMKGRSPLAMLRGMNEWHGDLAKEKAIKGTVFKASGFKEGLYTVKGGKGQPDLTWKIQEILTSKQLAAEGRALRHCVYSYAWHIQDGKTSIWSMTLDNEKLITVEVRNVPREIVQARGKVNRPMTSAESKILLKWAQDNRLGLSLRL